MKTFISQRCVFVSFRHLLQKNTKIDLKKHTVGVAKYTHSQDDEIVGLSLKPGTQRVIEHPGPPGVFSSVEHCPLSFHY